MTDRSECLRQEYVVRINRVIDICEPVKPL